MQDTKNESSRFESQYKYIKNFKSEEILKAIFAGKYYTFLFECERMAQPLAVLVTVCSQ